MSLTRAPLTTRRRLIAALVATATAFAITAVAVPAGAAASPMAIPGTKPNWTPKAVDKGATPASSKVSFGVLLKMRDQAGAAALADQLTDPASASYGKWLTNAQFKAGYAPAVTDVAAVQSWLGSQGFTVSKTLTSGMYVEASGTAAQISKTFATPMRNYKYKGKTVHTNTATLTLPAGTPLAVTGAINAVIGVDQGRSLKNPSATLPGPPDGARYGVQPCSAYYSEKIATDQPSAYGQKEPYAVCGYSGAQLQGAYGETPLLSHGIDGRGVTVAITDAFAAPTILADTQTYSAKHGLPQLKAGQFSQILPPADGYGLIDECGGSGWYGEETLDVQAVHTMAPGAKIVYVGATDCSSGLDTAWAETIDDHVADIVTNSWGDGVDTVADLGQDYIDFYQQFSLEAALTGITVNFSSGDDGDYTKGGTDLAARTLSFPSDLPYVTSVGGTTLQVGSRNQWLAEYGWQSAYSSLANGAWAPTPPGTYSSGGGGGTSQLFVQPSYQRGKVPASLSKANGGVAMRVTPDIAMDGDANTGMTVGETQAFPDGTYYDEYRIGGTSLSSPLLAGVIAVANQVVGHPLGFVNPLYYKLVNTPAVHDEVAPRTPQAEVRTDYANFVDSSDGLLTRLRTIDVQTSTLHDTRGYDNETGVGSPNGLAFFAGLAITDHFGHR
jgi:subtilase family serine protease